MWMFLGPLFDAVLSSLELLPADWCGKADGHALGSQVVTRDGRIPARGYKPVIEVVIVSVSMSAIPSRYRCR